MQRLKKLLRFLGKALFKRRDDADSDLNSFSNARVGVSVAADWSWGVGIAVGMGIMTLWGIAPFLIWAVGNTLAIPLVGVVRKYLPQSREWPRFIILPLLFLVVEYFAITINMQSILTGFGGDPKSINSYQILPRDTATIVVVLYGLLIAWYVHKGGLKIIMLSDLGSYVVQMTAAVFIAIAAYLIGGYNNIQWLIPGGLDWARFAFLGIITGTLATGHQWQKYSAIDEKRILPVTLWGGFVFFMPYMVCVFFAGLFFSKHIILGWALLVIMVGLATSTIDSSCCSFRYVLEKLGIKNKILGSALPIIIILSWPLVNSSSIVGLWSIMAKTRYPIILGFIAITAIIAISKSDKTIPLLKKYRLMR